MTFKVGLNILRRISRAGDLVRITVSGGPGGHGLPKFGGVGGKGGNVYVQGDKSIKTLNQVIKEQGTEFKGGTGACSKRTRLVGDDGLDVTVKCPLGVSVLDDLTGANFGDIYTEDDKILVALGGRGGSKENEMHGVRGQKRCIRLDLRVIADIGLVGFPNAGKSTLLASISRARPKIASYPFTTIRPNLGQIQYDDYRNISVADLPGLVEGAHKNIGLGHNFLKHTTRTRLLAFVVDINGFKLPNYPEKNIYETISLLVSEIKSYDDLILHKPAILIINKIDMLPKNLVCKKIDHFLAQYNKKENSLINFEKIISISAKTGNNIDEVKKSISRCDRYTCRTRSTR